MKCDPALVEASEVLPSHSFCADAHWKHRCSIHGWYSFESDFSALERLKVEITLSQTIAEIVQTARNPVACAVHYQCPRAACFFHEQILCQMLPSHSLLKTLWVKAARNLYIERGDHSQVHVGRGAVSSFQDHDEYDVGCSEASTCGIASWQGVSPCPLTMATAVQSVILLERKNKATLPHFSLLE